MKKKMSIALALLLCMVLVFSAVGCGSNESADTEETADSYTIGFIPMTLDNEFYVTMMAGADKFASENNIELNTQAGATHTSAEDQLKFVETMIASQVDAICLVPASKDGLVIAAQKCQEAGIPLINIDTKLDDKLIEESGLIPVPFFGTDNYQGASIAGQYVLDNYPEGTKVALLTGVEGQENTYLRQDGFLDTVGDKVEIVARQTANWSVEEAYTATQNIISANPDVQLFFCSNDNMAIGALRAVQEAGLADKIGIIGFDAVSEAVKLVASGDLLGTVAQDPIKMAELGLQACLDILNGEKAYEDIPLNTDTGTQLVTKETSAKYLEYLAEYGL